MSKRMLALGPSVGLVLGPQRRLVRLSGVAIWEIFLGSGRAGDIHVQFVPSEDNYQRKIISLPRTVWQK